MSLRERVPLYLFSVPVVFLSAIQSGDLLHLLIAEFETEQIKILPYMLRVGGTGDYNNPSFAYIFAQEGAHIKISVVVS